MLIDLNPLNSGIKKEILINETINFEHDDLKNTSIKAIDEVLVEGRIEKISDETYHLELIIKTNMYLEDAITLEIIKEPVHIVIDKMLGNIEEDGEYYKILQNSLDIIPIVWENIVLEVPLRVVKEEKETIIEGDGWSLNKIEDGNPLSELKELLDMEGKR